VTQQGFTLAPLSLGPAGNLFMMAVVALYCFLVLPLKDEEAQDEAKVERRRNMWMNARWRKHVDDVTSSVSVPSPPSVWPLSTGIHLCHPLLCSRTPEDGGGARAPTHAGGLELGGGRPPQHLRGCGAHVQGHDRRRAHSRGARRA
jgi:hypothetical protein